MTNQVDRLTQEQIDEVISTLDGNDPFGAVYALGHTNDIRVIPALADTLLTHPKSDVRRAAAYWLGQIGHISAVDSLLRALDDEDRMVRYKASDALVDVGEAAIDKIAAELTSETWRVRFLAAYTLAKFEDKRALPVLLEAIASEDENTRYDAARALGGVNDREVVPVLIAILDDPGEDVRKVAVISLGAYRDPRAIPALITALKDEERFPPRPAVLSHSKWPREVVISALAGMRDDAANLALIEAIANPKASMRDGIIMSLVSKSQDKRAIPVLRRLMRDTAESDSVRTEAMFGLVDIIGDGAADDIIWALNDSTLVEWAPGIILNEIKTPEALAVVEEWEKKQAN